MGGFICNKPIMLSGTRYVPGDVIPEEAIESHRVLALTRSGYVVKGGETALAPEDAQTSILGETVQNPINLPIVTSEGLLTATVSPKSAATAFLIIQNAEAEAKDIIATCDDKEALLLVDAADRRKAVLKAVKDRCAVLTDEKAGDADGEDV